MAKNKADKNGFVYSTDPNFSFNSEEQSSRATLPPAEQKLKVVVDTKHRAGKCVTLVKGFVGTDEDLETLSKMLKNFCGTGGSAKDGEVIIQGDQKMKVLQWLNKNGYAKTKA